MNESDFRRAASPGRLEPTTFLERRHDDPLAFSRIDGFGYVPNDLPSGLRAEQVVVETYDLLLMAERSLSTLGGYTRRVDNPALLIGPFARKEARDSSAIENTIASEEQLALFDADATAIDIAQRDEVREVSNYLKALRQGLDDPRPICLNLIRDLHATLLSGATRVAGRPGEFRRTQNAIGNQAQSFQQAKFVPPPPQFVAECLNKLEAFINAKDNLPSLIRLALSHYQFECIHPFDDGNGRVGRLLVALQLCKQGQLGLPIVFISGFLERNRERYYRLLYDVSSKGEWTNWLRFFLLALTTQANDTLVRVDHLDRLRRTYLEHKSVRRKRASGMLPTLIEALFSNKPAITVAEASRITKMGPASAGKLIDQLVDAGILREATGRKHSRIFLAHQVLAIMNLDLSAQTGERPAALTSPTDSSESEQPG